MRTYKNRKRFLSRKREKNKDKKTRKQKGGMGSSYPYSAQQNFWEEGVLNYNPSYSFSGKYPRFKQMGGKLPVYMPVSYSNRIRGNIVPYF